MKLWTLIPGVVVSSYLMYIIGLNMNYTIPLTLLGWFQFNLIFAMIVGAVYLLNPKEVKNGN